MAKKNNYDSDFCGSLPLNNINVIQPYGYLIVLEKEHYKIIQVSENIADLLGKPLKEIVGSMLNHFAETIHLNDLQDRFGDNQKDKFPLTLTISNVKMLALAHFKAGYIILEIEKEKVSSERSFTNVYEEVKYAMTAIESKTTVQEVSQTAIHELRKITGFDGIMMYQFDKEWNGTVIAEEKVAALENYLGHTFPGSDVPKQARELYLKNAYRLIPDRDFEPVRLYPVVNPVTNSFIDLSDCNLRGVAAVHLEYLKNMNVQSSMSIRVIDNDKLWGLIACHHLTPHYLNFEICSICEMISSVISNRISSILNKTSFEIESDLQKQQTDLIAKVYAANDIFEGLLSNDPVNLMALFNASGVVIAYQNKIRSIGVLPDQDMVENLFLWLQNKQVDKVFFSENLSEIFDEALPFSTTASGVIVIPINMEKGEFMLAFRPEIIQTINWGGDPNKTINFEPDGKKYHPRASFKIWQEKVHHTSRPWRIQEINAAENLRRFIYEFITKNIKNQ